MKRSRTVHQISTLKWSMFISKAAGSVKQTAVGSIALGSKPRRHWQNPGLITHEFPFLVSTSLHTMTLKLFHAIATHSSQLHEQDAHLRMEHCKVLLAIIRSTFVLINVVCVSNHSKYLAPLSIPRTYIQ